MGRAPCCDKANVKKGPWSPEEDAKLKAYIDKYGTGGNWIALPQKIGTSKIYFSGLKRCGKSCRLRWLNYLRPNIKHGGFTEEEDNIICSLYISIGSRWSVIAAQLPGRTDNDIKNYWNTRLKKKLLGRRKQCNFNNRKDMTNTDEIDDSNAISNSALERLQLHMQLQGLQNQNPFSFYNINPALWPTKLHPFQEKMIHNLQQPLSASSNPDTTNINPVLQKEEFYKPTLGVPFVASGNDPMDSNNLALKVEAVHDHEQSNNMGNQQVSALQAELDDMLNMTQQEDQMDRVFDCFGEINNSKDSLMMWWSNDFDAKSASFNSWGSSSTTPVLQQEGMFQDYELGYIS